MGATQWGSRVQPHAPLSSTKYEYTIASKVGWEIIRCGTSSKKSDTTCLVPPLYSSRQQVGDSAPRTPKHREACASGKIRIKRKHISASHAPGDIHFIWLTFSPSLLARSNLFASVRCEMLGLHESVRC